MFPEASGNQQWEKHVRVNLSQKITDKWKPVPQIQLVTM